jgi:CysZ protein
VPVAISLLFLAVNIYYGIKWSAYLAGRIVESIGLSGTPTEKVSSEILLWLIGILIKLGMFLLAIKLMKYIVLILLSPLFAYLSERTEELLSGTKYPFSLSIFLKDVIRGIFIALRNAFIEFGLMALFFILSVFLPPAAVVAAPLLFLIGIYFYGFSMMDYCCERRRMTISQSVRFMRRNRWLVMGNGLMYSLLDSIPVVGLIVAPVNAVIGATTALLEKDAQGRDRFS